MLDAITSASIFKKLFAFYTKLCAQWKSIRQSTWNGRNRCLEVILNRNDSKVERFKTIENVHWLGFISFIAKVKYTMQTKMDAVLLFKLYEIVNKVTFSIDSHYLVDLFDFGHSKNSKQFNLSEEWATWNFNMSILILISISISECLSFFRLWESTHWFYLSNSPTLYLLEKKELSFITYSH